MVDLKSGMIELEQKNGLPATSSISATPATTGTSRSILLKSKGGDGDAIDAIVLARRSDRVGREGPRHRDPEPGRHGREG